MVVNYENNMKLKILDKKGGNVWMDVNDGNTSIVISLGSNPKYDSKEKTAEVRKGNVGRANEATYDGKGQDGIRH